MAGSGSRGETASAKTRDGIGISYRIASGDPARRCVLVHSLAMDKTFWDKTIAAMSGEAEVLVVDCRGHGISEKPAGPYSVEQFADDVADVMEAVGWHRAAVAGASMGGCVAQAVAARHPDRVAALGLIDTTAWYGENAEAAWKERADKAVAEGLEALVGFQKTRWFSDRFRVENPQAVEEAVAVFLRNDIHAYAETCAMLGRVNLLDALPRFAVPCRILVGSEDYATPPEMARRMADLIPGSTWEILEGVRHFSPLEVPARIASELLDLMQQATWRPTGTPN